MGAAARDRAGDDGEYHHSKNLTKKMERGRRNFNEPRRMCGDVKIKRRMIAKTVLLEGDFWAAA